MSENKNADTRHRERMARKKEVIDAGIERATIERGIVIVLTGNGKGKSSSGFGMIARALGHDMKTAVVQFIKGSFSTGEEAFFRRFPESVDYNVMGDGFTWDTQNKQQDIASAERAWEKACSFLENPEIDIILLDELNIVLHLGYLDTAQIIERLKNRPSMQHVIITGRSAPKALIDYADTVTEMRDIKHAFQQGITAQRGVEL